MADAPTIVVIGAGGHARVIAESTPHDIAGHLSPDRSDPDPLLGPWLGTDASVEDLAASGHRFVVGLGFVDGAGARRRSALLAALDDVELATITHAEAIVSPSSALGPGVFVAAGAVVGTRTEIGRGSIVNTGAVIDHDGSIGRNVHLAPRVVLSGGVHVGDDSLVGVGATVRQGIRIGARVVVGAGAVVLHDLPDDTTAVGVPARPVDR